MSGERPLVYWDACIFIAWLDREPRKDISREDLEYWARLFRDDKARLVTSAVTGLEILESRMERNREARDEFHRFMRPPRGSLHQISPPVLEMAYTLREHFASLPAPLGREKHPTLSTPDAIHLATAVLEEVDVFHTTDGGNPNRWGILDVPDLGFVGAPNLEIVLPKADRNIEMFGEDTGYEP